MRVLADKEDLVVVEINSDDLIVRKNDFMTSGTIETLKIFKNHIEMVIDTDFGKVKRNFHFSDLLTMNDAIYEITHPRGETF